VIAAVLNDALEQGHVESHLHPEPTYDLEAHPVPTGREEIWRFTPIKRLRGLLEGPASDARLELKQELPAGVTLTAVGSDEAMAMVVRGFVEPIARELPMEYALELNRLIELQMEGAVG